MLNEFTTQSPEENEIREMYRKLALQHDLPADFKVPQDVRTTLISKAQRQKFDSEE